MADSNNGIIVQNIPSWADKSSLQQLFTGAIKKVKGDFIVEYILHPLNDDKSEAFVCFSDNPGNTFQFYYVITN